MVRLRVIKSEPTKRRQSRRKPRSIPTGLAVYLKGKQIKKPILAGKKTTAGAKPKKKSKRQPAAKGLPTNRFAVLAGGRKPALRAVGSKRTGKQQPGMKKKRLRRMAWLPHRVIKEKAA